jgi:hypothetical protein
MIMVAGVLSQHAAAQSITMDETLAFVNNKLGKEVKIEIVRGSIVAKYFNGGEMFREDIAPCKLLDHSEINYDTANRIFYINCEGNALCVDRILYERKIKRQYVRISFPVDLSDADVASLQKAMKHMIRLVVERKYQSNVPFE